MYRKTAGLKLRKLHIKFERVNSILSVGAGRRNPVTMRKVSLKMLSVKRACALQHQAGAQYSAVE